MEFIRNVYLTLIGVNVAAALLLVWRGGSAWRWYFLAAAVLYMIVEYTAMGLRMAGYENHWWYNYAFPLVYLSYAVLFLPKGVQNGITRKIILVSLPLYVAGTYIFAFAFLEEGEWAIPAFQLAYLFIVVWSLLWFLGKLRKPGTLPLSQEPAFWIALGQLASSALVLLFYALDSYLKTTGEEYLKSRWALSYMNLFNIAYQFCVLRAVWLEMSNQFKTTMNTKVLTGGLLLMTGVAGFLGFDDVRVRERLNHLQTSPEAFVELAQAKEKDSLSSGLISKAMADNKITSLTFTSTIHKYADKLNWPIEDRKNLTIALDVLEDTNRSKNLPGNFIFSFSRIKAAATSGNVRQIGHPVDVRLAADTMNLYYGEQKKMPAYIEMDDDRPMNFVSAYSLKQYLAKAEYRMRIYFSAKKIDNTVNQNYFSTVVLVPCKKDGTWYTDEISTGSVVYNLGVPCPPDCATGRLSSDYRHGATMAVRGIPVGSFPRCLIPTGAVGAQKPSITSIECRN